MKAKSSFNIAKKEIELAQGEADVTNVYRLSRIVASIMISRHGVNPIKANCLCEGWECKVFYEHAKHSKTFNLLNL